jgi:hypothetical protein
MLCIAGQAETEELMTSSSETIPSQFRKGVVELAILALLHDGEADLVGSQRTVTFA